MRMELENGGGEHRPYLHTINVKPAEDVSLLVTPLATGRWPLHRHFEAGIRTLRVLPAGQVLAPPYPAASACGAGAAAGRRNAVTRRSALLRSRAVPSSSSTRNRTGGNC